jgi:osmotically-inducible protein OsmY
MNLHIICCLTHDGGIMENYLGYRESDSFKRNQSGSKKHDEQNKMKSWDNQNDPFREDYAPVYRDQYYGKNYFGIGPKGYSRSPKRIVEEASERLSDNSELNASEIKVDIKDNVLILRGEVESRRDKKLAESLVEFISGVEDVQNELHIQKHSVDGWIPGMGSISDET